MRSEGQTPEDYYIHLNENVGIPESEMSAERRAIKEHQRLQQKVKDNLENGRDEKYDR